MSYLIKQTTNNKNTLIKKIMVKVLKTFVRNFKIGFPQFVYKNKLEKVLKQLLENFRRKIINKIIYFRHIRLHLPLEIC